MDRTEQVNAIIKTLKASIDETQDPGVLLDLLIHLPATISQRAYEISCNIVNSTDVPDDVYRAAREAKLLAWYASDRAESAVTDFYQREGN